MSFFKNYRTPFGYVADGNQVDAYGVDHSNFSTRDEVEYQFERFEKEKQMAENLKQQGIEPENYPQLGTAFWGNNPENNYGFGASNISANIENRKKQTPLTNVGNANQGIAINNNPTVSAPSQVGTNNFLNASSFGKTMFPYNDSQLASGQLNTQNQYINFALFPKSMANDDMVYKVAQNTSTNTASDVSNSIKYKLGTLSGLSESGHDPAAIGDDNSGGPSYGAYQIATYTGTMNKYLNFIKNNPQYRNFYDTLERAGGNKAATLKDPNFVNEWKTLSQNDNFNNSQYNFIINTHLQPLLNSVQNKELLNIDNRHPVVKDALYSMSVQHGKAAQIVNNTLQELQEKNAKVDDETLLRALYKKRADYVKSLPASQSPGDGRITQNEKDNIVNKRYPNELKEALKYLGL